MNTPRITNTIKPLLACVVAASLLTATSGASAAETIDHPSSASTSTETPRRNPISIATLAGHGEKEAMRTSLGGRIVYTLEEQPLRRRKLDLSLRCAGGTAQSSVSFGGAEVGYELAVGSLFL